MKEIARFLALYFLGVICLFVVPIVLTVSQPDAPMLTTKYIVRITQNENTETYFTNQSVSNANGDCTIEGAVLIFQHILSIPVGWATERNIVAHNAVCSQMENATTFTYGHEKTSTFYIDKDVFESFLAP